MQRTRVGQWENRPSSPDLSHCPLCHRPLPHNDVEKAACASPVTENSGEWCDGGRDDGFAPHKFEPGIDIDTLDQPDPRWCNTCGYGRRVSENSGEEGIDNV